MPEIPTKIKSDFLKLKAQYSWYWLGFDAKTNKYAIFMLPYWMKKESLIIQKAEL